MAEYFVDGFLLVQDLYSLRSNNSPGNSKLFQNFYVNVGNDPDGRNNPSCPNAPFMTIANDGSSQSGHFYDPKYRRWIWRYGVGGGGRGGGGHVEGDWGVDGCGG